MSRTCDFAKFGCPARLANDDHLDAHLRDKVSNHLQLLCVAFDKEVHKNQLLSEKLDSVHKLWKDNDEKQSSKDHDKRGEKEVGSAKRTNGSVPEDREKDKIKDREKERKEKERETEKEKEREREKEKERKEREREIEKEKEKEEENQLRRQSSGTFSGAIGRRGGNQIYSPSDSPTSRKASESPKLPAPTETTKDVNKRPVERKSLTEDGIPPGFERAILWEYDPSVDEWARGQIVVKIEQAPFAAGALRLAHKVEIITSVMPVDTPPDPAILGDKTIKTCVPLEIGKSGDHYVAKISKTTVPHQRYFEDVKMQCICKELGAKFNDQGVPKKVEFLMSWVLEIPRGGETVVVGIEPLMTGKFMKFMTNDYIIINERNTPQAFSHFTWEHSNHTLLVVDLQGVEDFYTDPQVHTKGGKDFGLGNLGMRGIEKFLKSHKCNPVCFQLNLPAMNVDSSMTSKRRLLRGTMKAPSIEKDLECAPPLPDIEAPSNLAGGEFQCVQTLSGHDDRVICLVVHQQHLFSSTAEGTVKVWTLPGCSLFNTIRAHRKSVESMCFSDKYLFTASADHAIKVWDLDDFSLVERLKDHTGEVNVVCITEDRLLSASFDKSIKVWNLQNLKCTNTLEGHSKSVKSLCAVGNIAFSGSNDGTIKVWSLTKMQCIFSVDAHEQWVKALALKDYSLFSGAHDFLIKEWDLKSFMASETIEEHTDNVTALLTTQRFLFSASEDKTIKVWSYNSQKSLATLKGHRSGVQGLCTDGKHLFSSSDDYSIKVWKWVSK